MRVANSNGRAVLVIGEGIADVAESSGGRFGPDPMDVLADWAAFAEFAAGVDSATAPLRSRLPNKRGNTPLLASGDLGARHWINGVAIAARAFQAATPPRRPTSALKRSAMKRSAMKGSAMKSRRFNGSDCIGRLPAKLSDGRR